MNTLRSTWHPSNTSLTDNLSLSIMDQSCLVPPFALFQTYDKLSDHLELHHEYQNCIMQEENGRIKDLATAVPGSILDDLAYRAASEYTTVRKQKISLQNVKRRLSGSLLH